MNRPNSPTRITVLCRHVLVALAGFACTLPSLANITFPNAPLQTGSSVPPNVMMLFDDSGSMYWTYLYIHTSSGAFPTIAVPAGGAAGTTAALTSTNTGDETSKGSLSGVTDGYGNSDCSNNGSSGTADTAISCIVPSINNDKYIVDQTYATNGLYYNPAISYTPWHFPDGTQQASTAYTAVDQSHNNTNYSFTAVDGTTKITETSPTVSLLTHTETFYVPKSSSVDSTQAVNYYRYQILGSTEFPSASGKIYQAQLLQATDVGNVGSTNSNVLTQTGVSAAKNAFSTIYSITVPAGATVLTVTTSGGTGADAALYVRQGSSSPTTTTYTCRSNTTGTNNQTCTINTPTAGTYKVGVYGNGAAVAGVTITGTVATPTFTITKGVTGVGCNDNNVSGYDWRFCTEVTPTGRTEALEEQNFANWYSFYETRIKTAKASLSAAFSTLTTIPRVGFRDIWDRNDFDIPVATDDGLFEDKAATTSPVAAASLNKTNWFKTMMTEYANDGTPLRDALNSMGEYYSNVSSKNGTSGVTHTDTGATGPYGPESGTDQIACRQNFTILSTDGYWNESFSGVSGDANSDNTAGTTQTSAVDGSTYTYSPVSPYKDSTSDTLADVAMHYWKTDLRTDLANKVPITTADPAFWQHMTTFTISIGAAGTLNPTTTLAQIAAGTAITWPVAVENTVTTIDDLFHAAINGHGSFVVASDPVTFVNALTGALAAIATRTSASSNVSASAAKLTTSTQLFQSNFVIGNWTGDVFAYPISTAGVVSTTDSWQASLLLPPATVADKNGTSPLAYTSRKIYTFDGTAGQNFPTAAQQTTLGGVNAANYIKGDQSNEVSKGGTFRSRNSVLGDMIDSSPVFVPADTTVTPNTPAMLYVGANDGMMHAFNASTGAEVFAYVPGGESMATVATLEDPKYVHTYMVDGAIAVSTKAQTKTATDTVGKNILVGVMGRGGNTVYALDVSDPANFGTGKVLWEYTDPDMGNSLGTPVIAQLNTGVTGVIISNGYNSTSGHSIIYVLDIHTGAKIAKLDSGLGDTSTNNNGMATPVGWDADRSGTVDLIYAGDLLGNVWSFDVSESDPTKWGIATTSTGLPAGTKGPLYTAKDASGNVQPITSGMAVGLNPSTFDRWVFFGTGRYLSSGDPANKNIQTWYGLIDQGKTIPTVTTRNSTTLKQRTIVAYTTVNGKTVRAFSQPVAGDMTGLKGWYLDLEGDSTSLTNADGERIVTDDVLLAGVLLAASIIPSTDACSVGGSGFINAIDAFTGGAVTNPFFDISGNGTVDSGDKITTSSGAVLSAGSIDLGVGMPSLPSFIQKLITATGSSGNIGQVIVSNPTNSGRISWREVLMGN